MRICKVCGRNKPLDEYPIDSSSLGGRRSLCRECHRSKQRESWNRRKKNPEVAARVKEQRKKYDAARYADENHRIKRKARTALMQAVCNRKITRMPCEICGSITVEAHHDDYNKPLEVRWLCKSHHTELHLNK